MMGDKPVSPTVVTTSSRLPDDQTAPSSILQENPLEAIDIKDPTGKKKFELTDQTNILPARQLVPVFMGLMAAVLVSVLDQSIVSTAIPTISAHFNAGESYL